MSDVDGGTPVMDEELPTGGVAKMSPTKQRNASLWGDAWRQLRRSPSFVISLGLILLLMVVAAFPGLFTNADPQECFLTNSLTSPNKAHIFGMDLQGCDYYARTIYGARVSMIIGVTVMAFALVIALALGSIAGYYGGAIDSVIARITDIAFALPFILGAIVMISALRHPDEDANIAIRLLSSGFDRFDAFLGTRGLGLVVFTLVVLGWPTMLRLVRSSVLSTKESDYIDAARALGASDTRIITRHILPNALAPVIVYATISIGVVIAAEATLSFLGVGLVLPAISWGLMISGAQNRLTQAPFLLLFPGLFLSVTVFSFILMGDALRDALDPKLR